MYSESFLNACNQHPYFLPTLSLSVGDADSDAVSILSYTTTLASEPSPSSLRRASVDTTPSSDGSLGSSLRNISLGASHDARPALDADGPAVGTLIIRKACRYDCYCKCHEQSAVPSKGFLGLGGSKIYCTDTTCQAATSFEEPAIATTSFIRKALSQVMSSKTVKVRYDLNTFRMVSEGSDAMRYVKHGNLDKLKVCMKTGEATLWDTAPDGWSLLHVSQEYLKYWSKLTAYQTAAYNRQLPIVKYLLERGADTEVADVGSRYDHPSTFIRPV